jgi:hypothetical protein
MQKSKPLGTLSDFCRKCGKEVEATVDPTMRGGTDRDGSVLLWYRCPACRGLFATEAQRRLTLAGSAADASERGGR